MMRAVLQAHGDTARTVWCADSFQGLPPGDQWKPVDGTPWLNPEALAVTQAQVEHNFAVYGLLDDQVKFIPGWFADTLPGPVQRLAVLRLDGDLYDSIRDVLVALEPKVSPGGWVIVDDYQFAGCRQAVDEYRHEHRITAPIRQALPGTDFSVYWQKD